MDIDKTLSKYRLGILAFMVAAIFAAFCSSCRWQETSYVMPEVDIPVDDYVVDAQVSTDSTIIPCTILAYENNYHATILLSRGRCPRAPVDDNSIYVAVGFREKNSSIAATQTAVMVRRYLMRYNPGYISSLKLKGSKTTVYKDGTTGKDYNYILYVFEVIVIGDTI